MNNLTRGSLLARNTVWNLLGSGAPGLVALLAIPVLVRHIGVPRFGLLMLIWTVVGYFSVFDLGLGSALTQMVADRLGARKTDDIASLVWTSLALMLALSVLGTIVLSTSAPVLVHRILKIPASLQPEALRAFLLLAGCLPFMIVTTGLRGILEAQQRFGIVNAIRIPTNAFTFVGPLAVLPFSISLVPIVAVLATGRVLACLAYAFSCLRTMPELKRLVLARDHVRYVLRFGAWMTVSNVISPLMVYVDRLVIGTVLSVAAVAYYATPFEVVIRLLTIPSALAGVLFPAFTMSLAHDRHRAAALFRRGQKYIFLALFPIILAVVTLAPDGLSLWLGSDFAQHSTAVLRLLAIGVFFNSLSTLPWILIQSAGRPDLTAKFHIVELALYLPVLFLMVRHYGLIGAAIAWAGRVLLDSAALSLAAVRFLRTQYALISRVALLAGACGLFMIGTVFDTATQRIIYLVAAMSLAAAVSLIFFLSEERRRWLRFSPAPRYDPQGSGTT